MTSATQVRARGSWPAQAWLPMIAACASALACGAQSTVVLPGRALAAAGGARWDSVAAIETTATLEVGGMTGTVESVEDVRTGRSRTTATLGGMVTGEGFDGAAAWQQTVGGEVVVLDAPSAIQLAATTRWLTARGYFRATGARYRSLAAATVGGRQLEGVEAAPPGGAPIELWFDADGRLARTVHHEGLDTVTTTYDDYRTVDGIELAFRVIVDRGDPRDRTTSTVSAVRVRGRADDTAFARPQTDGERLTFATGGDATRVPFELIDNHIYIRAEVDGQPVRMIVDTGGLNLLLPAAAARLGLTSAGKLAASGAGDQKVDVALARGRELAVGDVRLARPVFYVLDLPSLADISGEPFDGLVGFELFHRLAVRIDYPAQVLTLTRRESFSPPAGATIVPLELRDRTPIAAGSIDGLPARFTVDTGAGNSLTVNDPFSRANGLEARYHPAFETITGWGAGGPARGKPVRFREIKLGDAAIPDVVGDLHTGDRGALADPDVSANLGAGVLRRFAVTFDYRDRKLYLEPGPALPRDSYSRSGLWVMRAGDALRVVEVLRGGPAARAGLARDDRIVAIDGEAVAARPVRAWRALLGDGEVGASHTLTVEAAGARRDRTLVLAEILP